MLQILAPEFLLALFTFVLFTLNLIVKNFPKRQFIYLALAGCALTLLPLFCSPVVETSLFSKSFIVNPFTVFAKSLVLTCGMGILFIVSTILDSMGERVCDFVLLLLLSLLSAFFLISSGDLVTLFISIEWMTLSLYTLTTCSARNRLTLEAGVKYLVMSIFSGALFLYGISLVYNAVGTIHFDALHGASEKMGGNFLFLTGTLLILSGIGFKITAFPFQFWAPDVYQGAPVPVTAFFATVSKIAGFVVLMKMMLFFVPKISFVLAFASAASLLYGNLGALEQTNLKRLFAYSAIGHAGYILMGIASHCPFGLGASLFYLAAYGLSGITAFLIVAVVIKHFGTEISDLRGLSHTSPLLAAVFFVTLLSLGGIPPLVGFFGKFLVLEAAIQSGQIALALLGAINVVISLYYYLRLIREMYLKQSEQKNRVSFGQPLNFVLLTLAFAIILFGIFQEPLYMLTQKSAEALLV